MVALYLVFYNLYEAYEKVKLHSLKAVCVSPHKYPHRRYRRMRKPHKIWYDIDLHHDKLYNKTNEMHFLEFYSDNIFYVFRIGKLIIFRRQFYCTCSAWTSYYHDWDGSILIVIAGSPHECMIHTINCMYSKIASWRWITCLFETCRGCYQNEIQESASRWFCYTLHIVKFGLLT